MLNRSCAEFRHGGTLTIVVLLLIPLLAMVAFAVDLGYVWRAEAELQTAADAAAHAGVSKLMSFAVRDIQPGLTETGRLSLRVSATQEVRARAIAFGQMHKVADADLVVNDADVEIGYIADPAAPPDSPTGQFLTGVAALLFPNSVRVTVRRDATVPQGPLPLFFGPITGMPTVSRTATAVATLRGQNLVGFQGDGSKLLPVGLSLTSYLLLIGNSVAPLGLLGDG
jgi:uncharacterized membrane protein